MEKYKKRANRMNKQSDSNSSKHMEKSHARFTVKSYLLYNNMVQNIRKRYSSTKSYRHKRMIASLICSQRVLRKYGLGASTRGVLGISRRHMKQRRRPISVKKLKMKWDVQEFYERDDNSSIKAVKQATITRKGVKKQVRLLADDMKNLHAKYISENKKISYSLFCKLRPFWIRKPNEKERSTCLCKIHDNQILKLITAFNGNMYESRDLNVLAKQIVCKENNKDCMYRDCSICVDKKLPYTNEDEGEQLTWSIWKNQRIEKVVKEKAKVITITAKETEQGTRETLSDEINIELSRACRHIFNIKHQYTALTYLRQNLTNDDIILHIDFSENCSCKYSEEIQSMHCGASKRHISLHTGVAYVSEGVIPFCSVSDAFYHDPAAIWAHLDPVIQSITSEKQYNTIHFVSDGPTTQYRNKQNFYLWEHKVNEHGFKRSTWNFMEAGHGNGAADGIGAAVKRSADNEVLLRKRDITCAKDLVTLQSPSSKVKMFLVDESQITKLENDIPTKLQPVPNTMKIHQLVIENPGSSLMAARVVSCFCAYPQTLLCACYEPDIVAVEKNKKVNGLQPEVAVDMVEVALTEELAPPDKTPAEANPNLAQVNGSQPEVAVDMVEVASTEKLVPPDKTPAEANPILAQTNGPHTEESTETEEGASTEDGHAETNPTPVQLQTTSTSDGLRPVDVVDDSLVNQYCVVSYDQKPYPGIVLDVDENDLRVTVMHSFGRNKFFWPVMEDSCWYKQDNLVTMLDKPPEPITKRNRNQKLDGTLWNAIENQFY